MARVYCRSCGQPSAWLSREEAAAQDSLCPGCSRLGGGSARGCDQCGDPICPEAQEAEEPYCAECWHDWANVDETPF